MKGRLAGAIVGPALVATPALEAPLGRLGAPFVLVIVLPALALALEAFGWPDRLAGRIRRVRSPLARLGVSYGLWLVASAVLTLDVAAVAAASVGMAVAGTGRRERRWQLDGAILGSNVGSLLFPFSNLTNLMLVAASGIGFAAYVGAAMIPQVVGALAVGSILLWRSASVDSVDSVGPADEASGSVPAVSPESGPAVGGPWPGIALAVAVAGSIGAVAAGLLGADMVAPFAIAAGVCCAMAVGLGRIDLADVVGGTPLTALAVIGAAVLLAGPIGSIAGSVPVPAGAIGLVAIAVVGGGLAALVNNLPAAAFGATWLAPAGPMAIVAFLIGTNFGSIATPHGSVATILARSVGARAGHSVSPADYMRGAWRYALVGTAVALVALASPLH